METNTINSHSFFCRGINYLGENALHEKNAEPIVLTVMENSEIRVACRYINAAGGCKASRQPLTGVCPYHNQLHK